MRDVVGGRPGTAIVIAGVVASVLVVPSATANGGGRGHAEHGNGNGAGHARAAQQSAPGPRPAPARASKGGAKRSQKAGKAGGAQTPPARQAPARQRSGAPAKSKRTSSSSWKAKPSSPPKRKASSGSKGKSSSPKKYGHNKVWICHATGSTTNPFVRIRPASPSHPQAHDRHQHDEDVIPAPNGECPGRTRRTPPRTDDPGGPKKTLWTVRAAGAPSGTTPPATTVITAPLPARAEQTVLGESATSAPGNGGAPGAGAALPADAPVTPASAGEDGGLPFTGLESWVLGLLGLLGLTAGLGLRLATRPRR